ncbi:MAG: phenylalanine--tRNA ligase subunit alpha [Pseudobdellovibrionaceae bacterium]|nr:phenylalanine--tRNA ligase subunit alpha [Pseudobdellovibrionaceae bacterium]
MSPVIQDLKKKLEEIKVQAREALESVEDVQALYDVKVGFLGKQGVLTQLMKEMGQLPVSDRPQWGLLVNEAKNFLEQVYQERFSELKSKELMQKLQREKIDMTLPGSVARVGKIHVLSQVTEELVAILSRIGYALRLGPIIESDFYNFEALNIPADHPARDMQDTFFLEGDYVLRTHTSPIQIHSLEKEKLPLRVVGTGAVFRCDHDISHLPHFHQLEGLCVDERISMADLKGTIRYLVENFFKKNLMIRFRPSFFPFTEPSAEVDCQCPLCDGRGCQVCKSSGWIEIGGCGLVNPKVFSKVGINFQKWQGFAFGFGIERMAMIRHRVDDIRLFPENDLRFVKQF